MNKKELIKAVIELPVDASGSRPKVDHLTTLELVKLLDEPEKVKVPKFVADWYEQNKEDFETKLFWFIKGIPAVFYSEEDELSKFEKWVVDENSKPFQTLFNMHQFGYEVDKEKKYKVKVKGIAEAYNCLNYNTVQKVYSISTTVESGVYIIKFTRKELEEAGFGWVFDCPGIEIEEVTE